MEKCIRTSKHTKNKVFNKSKVRLDLVQEWRETQRNYSRKHRQDIIIKRRLLRVCRLEIAKSIDDSIDKLCDKFLRLSLSDQQHQEQELHLQHPEQELHEHNSRNIVTKYLLYSWKISNMTPEIVLARMKMIRIYL